MWGSVSVNFIGELAFLHSIGDSTACPVKTHCSGRPASFYKNRGDYKEIETPPSSGEENNISRSEMAEIGGLVV